jgi:hypothetical protein
MLLYLVLFAAFDVRADYPRTEVDFAVLPPYCWVRFRGKGTPAAKMWNQKLKGNAFIHIHHYCAALHTMNLVNRTGKRGRQKYLLQVAIKEMEYVERKAGKELVLRPEIAMKKRIARLRLQNLASR